MAEELCKLPSMEYALVSSPSMHGSQGSIIGIIIFIRFIDDVPDKIQNHVGPHPQSRIDTFGQL